MKRTLTINIRGSVFYIDEDAYEKLKNYLAKINDHFSKEDSGHEIINDIESRIAELFNNMIVSGQKVIDEAMVDRLISIMGLPEDFSEFETNQDNEKKEDTTRESRSGYYKANKRLYRDIDSKIIGGVCSGLGHYLNMDKVLVRVIFIILFVATSGIAFPLYLILWIAVPKAQTTSQRLEMRGEAINVENIGKSFKDEKKETSNNNYEPNNKSRYYYSENRKTGSTIVTIMAKIFGIFLLLFGFASLITLILGLFTASKFLGIIPGFIPGFNEGIVLNHVFSSTMGSTMLIAILLILGIPILLIIYAGTKLTFNYISNSRSVFLSAIGIWIIGIIIAISSTFGAIDVFSTSTTITDNDKLLTQSDTIFVKLMDEELNTTPKISYNNLKIVDIDGKENLVASPKFTVEKNYKNDTEIILERYSKGNNFRAAKNNASKIEYNYHLKGNTLFLEPDFTLKNGKWRSQKLTIRLKLPENKVIYLDESLLPIIHDIKNTTNTWDGDMTGKYWIMQTEGLAPNN